MEQYLARLSVLLRVAPDEESSDHWDLRRVSLWNDRRGIGEGAIWLDPPRNTVTGAPAGYAKGQGALKFEIEDSLW
jgi:hypothetical protein